MFRWFTLTPAVYERILVMDDVESSVWWPVTRWCCITPMFEAKLLYCKRIFCYTLLQKNVWTFEICLEPITFNAHLTAFISINHSYTNWCFFWYFLSQNQSILLGSSNGVKRSFSLVLLQKNSKRCTLKLLSGSHSKISDDFIKT